MYKEIRQNDSAGNKRTSFLRTKCRIIIIEMEILIFFFETALVDVFMLSPQDKKKQINNKLEARYLLNTIY